jgi:hypothetical protein
MKFWTMMLNGFHVGISTVKQKQLRTLHALLAHCDRAKTHSFAVF